MSAPRLHVELPLRAGACDLPERAARHAQVLRLQPGDALTLFDGSGGEWQAVVTDMKRRVAVQVQQHHATEREAPRAVTLAVGMPANERMEWLIEKATELGAAAIVPLLCERSVLRLAGERADKKRAHWRAVAAAACEQCGRNRLPEIAPVQTLAHYLQEVQPGMPPAGTALRVLLSPQAAPGLPTVLAQGDAGAPIILLSGPEGGLSATEQQAALAAGFAPASLGARVLRADTAPLAALARIVLA